jgi:GGDEF domain-containing protein
MLAEAPAGALVARIGGDELGVVLEGVDLDEASRLGDDLRARVCAPAFVIGDTEARLTLAFGVATEPRSADGLLRATEADLEERS